MKTPVVAAILVMAGLTGCATMNKNECMTVDWRTVGYEDGAAGRSGARIGQYRKDCAKHGVTPDLGEYQAGRASGLREYCRPEVGFRLGESGGGYEGICPADLAPRFTAAYESGRELNAYENRARHARAEVERAHGELGEIEHRLTTLGLLIIDRDTTTEDRAHALVESRELAERYERTKSAIPELEEDARRFAHELEEYRGRVAYAD